MAQPEEFDYVIVGGGSAGCVLAAGLAADGRYSVALLEEGRRDRNPWIHIPGTFFKALQTQDAGVEISEPDASLDGRPFAVPQGRVLGGGSSVNGMIYMRGQAQDYDDWADAHGCTGWGYDAVLPIFKEQEANTRLSDPYHGNNGPLSVTDPAYRHPLCAAAIEAAVATGLPRSDDFNSAKQEGAGWYQLTITKGRRASAAVAFLKPVLGQDNLTLLTGWRADHVRIQGRRATGVAAHGPDGEQMLTARKEVILTAGSFHSPHLLMLSGIGAGEMLRRFGVDVVEDNPSVGANYHDHVGAPVTLKLKSKLGLHNEDRGLKALRHGAEYLFFRRGLLASNLLESGACADTDGDGRPDVQFNFTPFAPGPPGTPPLPFHGVGLNPMTMRPKSRGLLALASANKSDRLKFTANALQDEADMDTLRRGIRLAREIAEKPPFAGLVDVEVWPGPDVSSARGSNTLDDAIRAHARTIFHPAGTCRMGSDAAAVVDPYLRVNGIEGLRVADCSVMPQLTSGNTNAPTMMIAGRAVQFVLADA